MMYRLTRWNEQTEQAELKDWDEDDWKDLSGSMDMVDWMSLCFAFDKLAEYEDLEERYGNLKELISKQNTMKISMVYDNEMKTYWCFCPNCNKSLGWVHTVKSTYCSECGQKLKK